MFMGKNHRLKKVNHETHHTFSKKVRKNLKGKLSGFQGLISFLNSNNYLTCFNTGCINSQAFHSIYVKFFDLLKTGPSNSRVTLYEFLGLILFCLLKYSSKSFSVSRNCRIVYD